MESYILLSMQKKVIYEMSMAGISAALIAICSWIIIPAFVVPFTLQTFAIFLILFLFNFRISFFAIFTYLLLGIIGVPIFSGFNAGVGAIMGPTGGYLIGFIFMPMIYYLSVKIGRHSLISTIIGLAISLLFLYIFGSGWFYFVYLNNGNPITFGEILSLCVVPFIGPDIIKATLAVIIGMPLLKIVARYRIA